MASVIMPLVFAAVLCAQDARYPAPQNRPPQGAEEEAARLVALAPEKIISILREEPGLLLQVKKSLVHKAYEQGRLLDAQDLTDDALFRLIREDHNIAVLATREIEDRAYVRAKPNAMEREHENVVGRQALPPQALSAEAQAGGSRQNQEDEYWSHQDERGERGGSEPSDSIDFPRRQTPERQPSLSIPHQDRTPAGDQPFVERTEILPLPDPGVSDMSDLPRIDPESLPGLLNASAAYTDSVPPAPQKSADVRELDLQSREASTPPSLPQGFAPQIQPRGDYNQQGSLSQSSSTDSEAGHARHRANPYANVPALYDLYSQYWTRPAALERFGADIFRNGTGNLSELPMDMPVGPDYVVGPGDGLSIEVWGGVSQRLQRVVDREGRLALPEVGSVQVSGRTLGDLQRLIQATLRTEYRDVQADISVARLRSVRVYVVGDVERPGAYDVSSLSTPLNALYAARGPTSRGSLRLLRHYRGKQLVEEIDVYDLLLHGLRGGLARLEAGDTLLVPPLGPTVTIEGMVRRPSIYELHGERSLAEVLELAGGVLPTGTLREIQVERLQAHDRRTMLRVDIPEGTQGDAAGTALEGFQVQSDDVIRIAPILPYAEQTVFLDGHVFRPGKYAYRDGMRVSDVVKSYGDILPEPYKRHAEIIRLNPPDFTPAVMAFSLDDIFAGNQQDLPLKPFDTIRIFGRYDFEDPPSVTVTGEVRDPGDHLTNGGTYLRDAIYLAGGTTSNAQLNDVQVFRHAEDGTFKVMSVNLGKALAGAAADNILLQPKDRVMVHKSAAKLDPPAVLIQGEVNNPGKYPLGGGMSAAELVRLAGGLKRGAYTREAELTRYVADENGSVVGEHIDVPLAEALSDTSDADVRLRDGDVLTIRQLAGWNDVGSTIVVKGEVAHPGTYGVQEGERLSTVLARAGGLRAEAYPYGAIFERVQVRQIEEQHRAQLLNEVQDEGASLKLLPVADEDQKSAKDATLLQWKSALERLENIPPSGRQVIHISVDVKRWAGTSADITVRAGDVIFIPKRPTFVMVDGSVFNPTAVTFKPGKSAGWYLQQAGGPNNSANKKATFVIRADGSVAGGTGGLFTGGGLDVPLQPGDMVVVPEKAFSGSSKWRNTLQSAQLVSAVGIAVQVARGF